MWRWAPALVLACACEAKPSVPTKAEPVPTTLPAPSATTVDQFWQRGAPTFIVGTRGDDLADHRIATQVELVRGLVATQSPVVQDTAVDFTAWPERPIVYGGSDVNEVIAALDLPFGVDTKSVTIGNDAFEGDEYRLVAVVPETPKSPEFVVFAGTGPAGIAEINGFIPMGNPIVVADRFGALVTGSWRRTNDGLVAELGPRARRIEYRTIERKLDGAAVTFGFPSMVPAKDDDMLLVDAAMRGLKSVVTKLEIADPVPMSVFIYPDRRSKAQLTGNDGDGHAIASSRALHVLAVDPAALESLVAHEGTHVLGYYALGPVGTPLMGEGMAVWVAGAYGGKTLQQWRLEVGPIPFAKLVGPRWLELPEQQKYPVAAFVFEAALAEVGLSNIGDHLVGATFETWDEACVAAGTNAGTLQERVKLALAGAGGR